METKRFGNTSETILSGVRVVELSMWVQAPIAGRILGTLGADVIKVEPLTGDPARGLRIAFNVDTMLSNGNNLTFELANENKRSLVADLHKPEGVDLLHRLISISDVFVTNLRSSALAKFGADFESLAGVNPSLVYAQGTGLGEKGEWADRPCQDTIGMAHSGFLHTLSATVDEPYYVPGSLSDMLSGTFLAMGVLAALNRRQHVDHPQLVQCSQLQSMLWLQSMNIGAAANATQFPPFDRMTQFNPLFNMYRAQDGMWFSINAAAASFWPIFCGAIGRRDLMDDPNFASLRTRAEHRGELVDILDSVFRTRTRDAWLSILGDAGLWVGKINRVEDVLTDTHVQQEGYLGTSGDGIVSPQSMFRLDGQVPDTSRAAPELGADTDFVLNSILGLSLEDVATLRQQEVVW